LKSALKIGELIKILRLCAFQQEYFIDKKLKQAHFDIRVNPFVAFMLKQKKTLKKFQRLFFQLKIYFKIKAF